MESIAGAENPHSLMQVFGRGHQVTRNGAMVYVSRCQATEVTPRDHTQTAPTRFQWSSMVPTCSWISFIIQGGIGTCEMQRHHAPEMETEQRWYCAFPQIRDCAELGRIPVKPIAIDDVKVMNLGLGRSI